MFPHHSHNMERKLLWELHKELSYKQDIAVTVSETMWGTTYPQRPFISNFPRFNIIGKST